MVRSATGYTIPCHLSGAFWGRGLGQITYRKHPEFYAVKEITCDFMTNEYGGQTIYRLHKRVMYKKIILHQMKLQLKKAVSNT